ncbi:MAG TPA: DUF2695 domain-containing protein [Lysobacter sp.]|nr:DUF2695 domain-containing protein [Lysobacter sp.]
MGSSKGEHKARLREWKEAQRVDARKSFPLSNEILAKFFEALEVRVEENGCHHDTRQAGLASVQVGIAPFDIERLLAWCAEQGGFCDCEIILNTYGYWEENRDDD